MKKIPNFSKKYLITNEVLNAVTHGIGVGLSIAGLIILILKGIKSGSTLELVSYCIFGSSLILLYLSSTLYHSLIFTKARKVFKIFDHSSIYILIAGSYTPLCLITIGGVKGWALFYVVWTIALLGVIYKSIWIESFKNVSTLLYIGMGWLCIVAIKELYTGLGMNGFGLLLAGGLAFTIGAAFYSMRSVKYMHVLWHLFVMTGTAFVYFSILIYA
ncbi:hemolysin III [Carnobacterium iners]|uniref:Hemolysin III n=1 Tax=Carnobacterium iners TaxID=1073423 RepID=A0A1X7N686_9LACT|nr:hemolysin III family protein [Carnobacterium iners]SEL30807.1 hemolysin III [Carnobacterium iners]SMH32377.1 hemolysin III [Carnobacterium iners]